MMKRRYTEPGKQVNKNDSRKNSTPVVPTSSLAVVKTKAMSGSNQSLAKISVTGKLVRACASNSDKNCLQHSICLPEAFDL